jgi:MoaA/NifB/PqqE/SkfB family radical SAM enzyme
MDKKSKYFNSDGILERDLARKYRFAPSVLANIRLNYAEYLSRAVKLNSYPVRLYVEPTQRCNLKCITCYSGPVSSNFDMSMSLFKRIEGQLFKYAAEVDFFNKGESLIAENFTKMITVCAQYTFLPKIFTNAFYLPDEVAKALVDLGFFVNISFDATEPKLFEFIRRGSDFDVIVENINKLRELSLKSANRRFHLRFSSTMGLHNIHEAPKIVKFAHEHGVRDVMFGFYDGPWDVTNMLMADVRRSLDYFSEAAALADKYKVRFSVCKRIGSVSIERNNNWTDFSLPIDDYAPFYLEGLNPWAGDCGYPWLQSAVRANGDIVACCQKRHRMGDMCSSDFVDTWNSDTYQKLRAQKRYYKCMGLTCNLVRSSVWNGPYFSRRPAGSIFSLSWMLKDFIIPFLRKLRVKVPNWIYRRFT